MATITDNLQTILTLKGVGEYAAGLSKATAATESLAKATGGDGTGPGGGLKGQLAALGAALKSAGPSLAALTGLAALSVKTFADDENAIFRTGIVLKNLGSSLPIEELQRFSAEIAKNSSVDDEAIVSLGGLLARFGLAGDQIKSSLQPIVDASVATGISINQIGEAIGRAVATGQGRGLRELGIAFKSTGNQARDLKNILGQIDLRFAGAGAAELSTITGSIKDLKEALADLASAIVGNVAPALTSLLHGLKDIADYFSEHQVLFGTILGALAGAKIGGWPGALLGALAGSALASQGRGLTPVGTAAVGHGGNPVMERLLGKIADNTDPNKQADALAREVLGGPGTVAAGAVNWRDLQLSLGV